MNEERHPTMFQEGEVVLVTYREGHKKGESTKFASRSTGPFRVIDKLSNEIYRVLHTMTGNKWVVHINRMRRFKQRKPVHKSLGQLDQPMDIDNEGQDENPAPLEPSQEIDIGADQLPLKPSMPPQIRPELAELPFVLLARNPLQWVDKNRIDGWALTKSGQ
jgi:hypothetical protein